jgi:hypothetical protein
MLSPGSQVCFDGAIWQVEALVGHCARLRAANGTPAVIGLLELISASDYRLVGPSGAVEEAPPPLSAALAFLPEAEAERVASYAATLRLMECGHPSGFAGLDPAGCDARFDPSRTTLAGRVRLMATLSGRGEATLWRDLARLRADGIVGLVRKSLLRPASPTTGIDPRYLDVLVAVLDELVSESNPTGQQIRRLVHARLLDTHGEAAVPEPGKSRFYELVAEVGRGRFVFGAAKCVVRLKTDS